MTAVVRLTLLCAKYRGAHLCDSVNFSKPGMGHVSYYSEDMSEHSPLPGIVQMHAHTQGFATVDGIV